MHRLRREDATDSFYNQVNQVSCTCFVLQPVMHSWWSIFTSYVKWMFDTMQIHFFQMIEHHVYASQWARGMFQM